MYLIVTKTFPPEVGGMQNLMWGLANELSKHYMIKVFADYHENHKLFDEQVSFSIERVGGIKLLRKYRKAQLINEFIKGNKIDGIIADHWKSFCRGGRRRYGGRCHSCTGREREMKAHRIEGVDEVINERRVH